MVPMLSRSSQRRTKCRMNRSDRGSASMRSTCADKFARSLPAAASLRSVASGGEAQRKYESRDASATSLSSPSPKLR